MQTSHKMPKAKPKPKRKPGRARTYSDAVAAEILRRIGEGEPLAQICRCAGMPSVRTVDFWKEKDEKFASGYARAREKGFDVIAEDALRISDDVSEDPASRRVRVDTRRWLLSKWMPKRYGEKIEVENSGETKITIKIGGSEDARG